MARCSLEGNPVLPDSSNEYSVQVWRRSSSRHVPRANGRPVYAGNAAGNAPRWPVYAGNASRNATNAARNATRNATTHDG